jgi:hypothetical protein
MKSSAVATAQALLVLPVLLLIRRAFDVVIPQRAVTHLVLIGVGGGDLALRRTGLAGATGT